MQVQTAVVTASSTSSVDSHHPAFKADRDSLLGNILAGAKEIERLTSTDELLVHIANQTGISSAFFNRR